MSFRVSVIIFYSLTIIFGCSQSKVTSEQIARFNECQKNLKGYTELIKSKKEIQMMPDSLYEALEDFETLPLNEIVEKYEIRESDIDRFIESICMQSQVSSEIMKAFEKLDRKLLESEEILKANKIQMDSALSKIDTLSIKSFKFNRKDYMNMNDTFYIDENGDSVKVKVKVAKYE